MISLIKYRKIKMKVISIMGTRPEMIKMWSSLRKLDNSDIEHVTVHTPKLHQS